jgi:phosphoribosylformylglycinamidine cyclo-ligase
MSITYKSAGVDTDKEKIVLDYILKSFKRTYEYNKDFKPLIDLGYFANLIKLNKNIILAVSMDGVGTKLIIAKKLGVFNTVGIDLVAMNVNDILCVGAKPFALLDYIGIKEIDEGMLRGLVDGIAEGAKIAGIAVLGGELAQIGGLLKEFELVGTGLGIINNIDDIILGDNIESGDIILGIESSGIHSNGLSLARKVLFEIANFKIDSYIPQLRTTLGEELLKPTNIYTKVILELLKELRPKALVHITGGGLSNLKRVKSKVKFVIENLPPKPIIFELIQSYGDIQDKTMYEVFNMGIGFCVIIEEKYKQRAKNIIMNNKFLSFDLGYVVESQKQEVLIIQNKREILL